MRLTKIALFKIYVDMEWHNTLVICEKVIKGENDDVLLHAAELHAAKLSALTAREVRWNWQGSAQGHYVRPLK